MQLAEVIATYIEAAELTESGRGTVRHVCNSWDRRAGDVDPESAIRFREAALKDGLSPRTIESQINRVLGWLSSVGLPLPTIGKRLKLRQPSPVVPSMDSLGKLYVACETATRPMLDWISARDYLQSFLVVAYWSGFRLGDLFRMSPSNIQPDRISLAASKTGKLHELPLCPTVTRHLERLGPKMFAAGRTCPTHLRNWLAEAGHDIGVTITPQQIRRLSVTQWAVAGPEAGRIIHGERLGVLAWYYSPRTILERAAPNFVWPTQMLTEHERNQRVGAEADLAFAARHLSPDDVQRLTRIARAM